MKKTTTTLMMLESSKTADGMAAAGVIASVDVGSEVHTGHRLGTVAVV